MTLNFYWIFIFCAVIVSAVSQIFLKKSASASHTSFIKEYLNVRVIIGYGLMLLSTILVILSYRGIEYKNGAVVESLGYILVMILSYFFLQEKITKKKIIGNCIIVTGVILFYIA